MAGLGGDGERTTIFVVFFSFLILSNSFPLFFVLPFFMI